MNSDMARLIREGHKGEVVQLPDYYSESLRPKLPPEIVLGAMGAMVNYFGGRPRRDRSVVQTCGLTGKQYRKRKARAKMASISRKRNR